MTQNINKLEELFKIIQVMKKKYKKKLIKTKRMHTISEMVIVGSGAIATTNLFVTISTINPVTLVVATVFSAIATVGKTIKTSMRVDDYIDRLHIAFCQLSDLERDIDMTLSSDVDHNFYISTFNDRLSLIEDYAPPVKIVSKTK